MTDLSKAESSPTPSSKDQMRLSCDAEGRHIVVLDTFHLLTGKVRDMPGDCYCIRCSQPVPFVFNNGAPVRCALTPKEHQRVSPHNEHFT